jgi:hypothetical protein
VHSRPGVAVAVDRLTTAPPRGADFADRRKLRADGDRVVLRQQDIGIAAEADAAGTGPLTGHHHHDVGAQVLDLVNHLFLGRGADRDHQDHRRDADCDPSHRQDAAETVQPEGADCGAHGHHHAALSSIT